MSVIAMAGIRGLLCVYLLVTCLCNKGVKSSCCNRWNDATNKVKTMLVDVTQELNLLSKMDRCNADKIQQLEIEFQRLTDSFKRLNTNVPTLCSCLPEWTLFEGSCYRLNKNSPMTWQSARNTCLTQQADLAISNSASVNSFLGTMLVQNGVYEAWLGGTDLEQEGSWKWVNGTVFYRVGSNPQLGYHNFRPGEPSNKWGSSSEDCLVLYKTLQWNDIPCTLAVPFLCQTQL